MEFPWVVIVAIAFFVLRGIGSAQKREQRPGPGNGGGPHPAARTYQQRLLEELQRSLEEAARSDRERQVVVSRSPSLPAAPAGAKPPAVRAEEFVSLEEKGASAVARRRREVEVRNRELAGEHHDDFDARMREVRPVVSHREMAGLKSLRHAIIWNEVLGTPVSMRDD